LIISYLGIDYGLARIGVAISESGIMARPHSVIQNKGDKKNIAAIHKILCGVYDVQYYIVFGVPLGANGNETEMSTEIRRFGELVKNQLGVEVVFHNERYSSLEASEYIKSVKSKESIDAVAAAVILQRYLDSRRNI